MGLLLGRSRTYGEVPARVSHKSFTCEISTISSLAFERSVITRVIVLCASVVVMKRGVCVHAAAESCAVMLNCQRELKAIKFLSGGGLRKYPV